MATKGELLRPIVLDTALPLDTWLERQPWTCHFCLRPLRRLREMTDDQRYDAIEDTDGLLKSCYFTHTDAFVHATATTVPFACMHEDCQKQYNEICQLNANLLLRLRAYSDSPFDQFFAFRAVASSIQSARLHVQHWLRDTIGGLTGNQPVQQMSTSSSSSSVSSTELHMASPISSTVMPKFLFVAAAALGIALRQMIQPMEVLYDGLVQAVRKNIKFNNILVASTPTTRLLSTSVPFEYANDDNNADNARQFLSSVQELPIFAGKPVQKMEWIDLLKIQNKRWQNKGHTIFEGLSKHTNRRLSGMFYECYTAAFASLSTHLAIPAYCYTNIGQLPITTEDLSIADITSLDAYQHMIGIISFVGQHMISCSDVTAFLCQYFKLYYVEVLLCQLLSIIDVDPLPSITELYGHYLELTDTKFTELRSRFMNTGDATIGGQGGLLLDQVLRLIMRGHPLPTLSLPQPADMSSHAIWLPTNNAFSMPGLLSAQLLTILVLITGNDTAKASNYTDFYNNMRTKINSVLGSTSSQAGTIAVTSPDNSSSSSSTSVAASFSVSR